MLACLAVVARLLDDFGGHPVGRPDEGVALGHGARQLRSHPEVRQLHLPGLRQQDVPALDVAVHLHMAARMPRRPSALESMRQALEGDRLTSIQHAMP